MLFDITPNNVHSRAKVEFLNSAQIMTGTPLLSPWEKYSLKCASPVPPAYSQPNTIPAPRTWDTQNLSRKIADACAYSTKPTAIPPVKPPRTYKEDRIPSIKTEAPTTLGEEIKPHTDFHGPARINKAAEESPSMKMGPDQIKSEKKSDNKKTLRYVSKKIYCFALSLAERTSRAKKGAVNGFVTGILDTISFPYKKTRAGGHLLLSLTIPLSLFIGLAVGVYAAGACFINKPPQWLGKI